jgi:hypothetical protein
VKLSRFSSSSPIASRWLPNLLVFVVFAASGTASADHNSDSGSELRFVLVHGVAIPHLAAATLTAAGASYAIGTGQATTGWGIASISVGVASTAFGVFGAVISDNDDGAFALSS